MPLKFVSDLVNLATTAVTTSTATTTTAPAFVCKMRTLLPGAMVGPGVIVVGLCVLSRERLDL